MDKSGDELLCAVWLERLGRKSQLARVFVRGRLPQILKSFLRTATATHKHIDACSDEPGDSGCPGVENGLDIITVLGDRSLCSMTEVSAH